MAAEGEAVRRLTIPAAAIAWAIAVWLWIPLLSPARLLTAWLAVMVLASFALAVIATSFAFEGWKTNAATPWPWRLRLARAGQVAAACAYTGTVIWLALRAL